MPGFDHAIPSAIPSAILSATLCMSILSVAFPAMAQVADSPKVAVVGHVGIVHVSGPKPIFGTNGDADGIMFKTDGLDTWKGVTFIANLDTEMPEDQQKTLSDYQSAKTAYVTCRDATVYSITGTTTTLMAKGDHCTIDRITTP